MQLIAGAEVNSSALLKSINPLKGRLDGAGREADSKRLLEAFLDKQLAPESYYLKTYAWLARIEISAGRFEEAKGHLDTMEAVLKRCRENPKPDNNWFFAASEAYYLHHNRCWLYCEKGQLDLAAAAFDEAQIAYEAYAVWEYGNPTKLKQQHAKLELDLLLAASLYDEAERRAGEFLGSDVAANTGQQRELESRQLAAASQLAMFRPDAVSRARSLVKDFIGAEAVQGYARQDALFRGAQLALVDGDFVAATAMAEEAVSGGASPLNSAVASAVRLESLGSTFDVDQDAKLKRDIDALRASWMTAPARAAGSGPMFSDKARYAVLTSIRSPLAKPNAEPIEALDRLLEAYATHDLTRLMNAGTIGALELQRELLDEGQLGLLFWPGDRNGVGFVVSKEAIETFEIGPAELIRAASARLRAAIRPGGQPPSSDPDGGGASGDGAVLEWQTASADLQELLLPAGVLDRLIASRGVVLFGHDFIYEAPLRALRVGDRALCLQVPISEAPTPALLRRIIERAPDVDSKGAVIFSNFPEASWVDPLGKNVPRVDLPKEQLARWQELASNELQDALVLLGAEASVENVTSGLLAGRRLAVFYGHGDVLVDMERPSSLLLGGNPEADHPGRLTSLHVESLSAPQIVILGTCGAAMAPERVGGGGTNHLGGAFVRAGSSAVLLSMGDLPAKATALLLDALLEELGAGRRLDVALMRARRAVANTPGYEHPSNYCGLAVFGWGGARYAPPREAPEGKSRLPFLLIGAAAAAALLLLALRRTVRT